MNDSFQSVLAARRGYFNARFAEAQVTHPDLDGDAFLEVLERDVTPVVEAVREAQSDATLLAGQTLYDLALDLFAQGMLNRGAVLTQVWDELLPKLAPFLVKQPQRIAASVLNGAYNISQTQGARPAEWIAQMGKLVPLCADAEQLLKAGQVAAWRAGMAQYRLGALQILKTLDGKLARVLFGLESDATGPDTDALHYALMANPWYDPTAKQNGARDLQIVKRVGGFRGFGGVFVAPPRVAWTKQGFVATDGKENYALMADAFGAALGHIEAAKAETTAMPFKLSREGQVSLGDVTKNFPELANATSATSNQTTLAVTTDLTYAIYLVALV